MFTVPPTFTQPEKSEEISVNFTQIPTFYCEAYGTDVTLTFEIDNDAVDLSDFTLTSDEVDGTFPYGLETGYGLWITLNMDANTETCDTVSRFNSDNYQCVATNKNPTGGDRSSNSPTMSLKIQRTSCSNDFEHDLLLM